MGKGSKRRPTNENSYRKNWDKIFKKKEAGKEDAKKPRRKKGN